MVYIFSILWKKNFLQSFVAFSFQQVLKSEIMVCEKGYQFLIIITTTINIVVIAINVVLSWSAITVNQERKNIFIQQFNYHQSNGECHKRLFVRDSVLIKLSIICLRKWYLASIH